MGIGKNVAVSNRWNRVYLYKWTFTWFDRKRQHNRHVLRIGGISFSVSTHLVVRSLGSLPHRSKIPNLLMFVVPFLIPFCHFICWLRRGFFHRTGRVKKSCARYSSRVFVIRKRRPKPGSVQNWISCGRIFSESVRNTQFSSWTSLTRSLYPIPPRLYIHDRPKIS